MQIGGDSESPPVQVEYTTEQRARAVAALFAKWKAERESVE
jgi:hypothetical protein